MKINEKNLNEAQLRELLPSAVLLHRTDTQSREQWVAERTRSIGASNVAAMLGVSPWDTELQLAAKKRGELTTPQNRAMERGTMMEPLIRQWAEEDVDCPIYTVPFLLQNPRVPVLTANLDGLGVMAGEPFIVELKDSSHSLDIYADIERDQIPPREAVGTAAYQYWLQMQSQMAITGTRFGLLGVADGSQMHTFFFDRHEEVQSYIEEIAPVWWQRHVVERIDPTATASDLQFLRSMCPPAEDGEPLDLSDDPEAVELMETYEAKRKERLAIEKQAKAHKDAENDARAKIEQMMGDSPVAVFGEREATRKISERKGYTVQPGSSIRFSTRKAKTRRSK